MINRQNRFSKWRLHTALLLALPFGSLQGAGVNRTAWLDDYNVVWTTPSVNSAGSMPCGGGDTGLNVWVEDGDLLFYLQRSGSLAETNEYLKLGRVRLTLDPNPFLRFPNIRTSGEHTHPSTQAIDGNPKTKWFVLKNQSAWARIDLGPDGAAADSYIFTSADDRPGRDPRNWTLSGSNDGTSWTRLASEKDQDFPERFQSRSFAIPEPGSFRFYRFEFANDGDPDFQLGEIQLFDGDRDLIAEARAAGGDDSSFRQELKLAEGCVEIRGKRPAKGKTDALEAKIRIWAEIDRPVVRVDVDASEPVEVTASYENWRFKDEVILDDGSRHACMSLDAYPGELVRSADQIKHTPNGVWFYHRNPAETAVDIHIEQQKLEAFRDSITNDLRHRTFGGLLTGDNLAPAGTGDGSYQTKPFKAWMLKSKSASSAHRLRVVSHIDQTDTLDAWQLGLKETVLASADDHAEAKQRALDWWKSFWDRSWIRIHPENPDPDKSAWRIARNYNLFRYQLGCNASGEYPTKFNGGNFTYDANLAADTGVSYFSWIDGIARRQGPDWRPWGGAHFTAQNQRLVYWPMLKAGDRDAIHSQFELYRKALPGAQARVRKYFGHDGAVYSEYISAPGLALGYGYGWDKGRHLRGKEIPFGDPRADGTRGPSDLVEPGVMANRFISYHWESQVEHAYMILEHHRFTGEDIAKYVPFIENAVIFFDGHYRKREKIRSGRELGEDGKLVIYPSTSCESYRGAKNPTDLIAGLKACIEGILGLDDSLLGLRDKDYYRGFLKILPDYNIAEIEGERIMEPAESWKSYINEECPQFYPLFPFNRFDLLGTDRDQLKLFRDTWKHGTFSKSKVGSWHQDGIFFARMGMTAEAADFNTRKLDDAPRRFPTFWGPGHDWVPDHNWGGSGMLGLQEMLMQTVGDEILLFPAWPRDWDVHFKLHAPRQTTVEGRLINGKVTDLRVIPESRASDVKVLIQPD